MNYVSDCAVSHAHLCLVGMLISFEFAENVVVEDELNVGGVAVVWTDIEDQDLYGVFVL